MNLTSNSSFLLLLAVTASIFLFDVSHGQTLNCTRSDYATCNVTSDFWNSTGVCPADTSHPNCSQLAVMQQCLLSINCTTQDAENQLGVSLKLPNINRNISDLTVARLAVDGLLMLCNAFHNQTTCTSDDFTVDRTRLQTIINTANSVSEMCMSLNSSYSQMEANYAVKYNATIAGQAVDALMKIYEFINCSSIAVGNGTGGGSGGGGRGVTGTTVGATVAGGTVGGVTQAPSGGTATGGSGSQMTTPASNLPPAPPKCDPSNAVGKQCAVLLESYQNASSTVSCTYESMANLCDSTDAVSKCYANLTCLDGGMFVQVPVYDSFTVPYWLFLIYKWNATAAMCEQRSVLLSNTQCIMNELIGGNATRFKPSNTNNASLVCSELAAFYSSMQSSFSGRYNAATADIVVSALKKYYKVVEDSLMCSNYVLTTTANPGKSHSPDVASVLPLTVFTVISTLLFVVAGRQ